MTNHKFKKGDVVKYLGGDINYEESIEGLTVGNLYTIVMSDWNEPMIRLPIGEWYIDANNGNEDNFEEVSEKETKRTDDVVLSRSEYDELQKDIYLFKCLQAAGVGNWEGYSSASEVFNERYGDDDDE